MKLGKLEEEHDRQVKRESSLEEQIKETQAAFEQNAALAKEERERIRSQIQRKKERLADIEKQRAKLSVKLDKKLLEQYTRLLRRWPGSVIVAVRNGSCLGCNFAVLPQKMVELHREQQVAFCDNCGRLFSQDEDYKPEAEAEADNAAS